MKAIVIHKAKDLRIEERDEDVPGPGQLSVRLAAGGICGSDLHYFNHGGFGAIRLKEPMILGHEVAGHVTQMGEGVQGFQLGQLVGVSPSRPCRACKYCLEGLLNQCLNMRFYGSAMPFPHIQGAFSRTSCCGRQPVRRCRRTISGRSRDGRAACRNTSCNAQGR